MNLFELSAQYQKIMDEISKEEEISSDKMQELFSINDSFDSKVMNYTSIIKTLEANVKAIENQTESMKKRAESMLKKAEWLKDKVKVEMQLCDKKQVENEFHRVTLIQNNPKVVIFNEDQIPDKYVKHKIKETLEIAKSEMLNDLKNNIEIPGAFLTRDIRLQIK